MNRQRNPSRRRVSRVVSLRPCRAGDAELLSALMFRSVREGAIREYSDEQVQAWLPACPSAEFMDRRTRGGRLVLVALDHSGSIVGYGDLEADGHIDHLFVAPEHIGCGVGSALYDALEVHARNSGIGRLYVEASEAAQRLFLARGFNIECRNDKMVRGISIHNYSMSKLLGR